MSQNPRWTIANAASAFGINHQTLSSRLKKLDIPPGKDGKWSNLEICAAVFGDIHAERLRTQKEMADKLALENAKARGEVVDRLDLWQRYHAAWAKIRSIIASSGLPEDQKDQIYRELSDLHASAGDERNGGN